MYINRVQTASLSAADRQSTAKVIKRAPVVKMAMQINGFGCSVEKGGVLTGVANTSSAG